MAPPLDLKDLRNLSKRDPTGYQAEFLLQYRHFQTQLQIFLLKPSEDYKPFSELVEYLCHVSDIYTKDMPNFPEQISNLLEKNSDILAPQLRKSLVSSLILLRSKNQVTPHSVLALFFKLFRCHDAGLREMLYKHIVSDITNINKKHKNQSLNTALQNFMFDMMQDPVEIAAKQSLAVMVELYRKRVWNDAKTVNVISTGCFSKFTSVVVSTLKFFLTVADDDEEDKIAENKAKASEIIKRMTLKRNVKKMNHGRRAKIDEAIADANALRVPHRKLDPNWPAIELINDPQGFVEKVFGVVRHSFERIEVRLMMMNFISRLITTHKLLLLNFYPFVQKYLMPKNEHVNYCLAILAQSIHELVPPTDLQPIVKHLVDKFVHDRSSTESIVAGLHTLREMSSRNPLIMNDTLVRDLAQYKNYKDRAVMGAARGIIGVYREKNPELLERKDRGKDAVMSIAAGTKPLEYGQTKVATGVDDIELLDLVEKLEQQGEAATQKKKKVDEIDLEGNVISYDDDEEEEEGEEGDEDMEDGDEEMSGDEEDEIDEEEERLIAIEKAAKKKSKGGIIVTEGAMSIAQALKLEQMQKKLIERQLENRRRRKRGLEEIQSSEDEEEEEEEEEEEAEEAEEKAQEPQEEKKEEIDIWQRIALISEGIVPKPEEPAKTSPAANRTAKTGPAANGAAKTAANGSAKTGPAANGTAKTANGSAKAGPAANGAAKTGPAKTEAAKSAKLAQSGPPAKKAKLELEEIEEESDEEDLEEMESGDEDMWEEVSGDEDDEEGEWEDVSEEEVEEVKGKEKKKPATAKKTESKKEVEMEEAPEKVNMEVPSDKKSDVVRILSEADFEKLNRLKQMKAEGKISLRRLKELSKSLEEGGGESEEEEGTGFVDPSDLTKGIKAPRKRGEERMKEILEKRKESKENSRHKEKLKWTTNEEKSKHKNLMMLVKGKMYAKTKLSMREQQIKKQAGIKRFKTRRHK